MRQSVATRAMDLGGPSFLEGPEPSLRAIDGPGMNTAGLSVPVIILARGKAYAPMHCCMMLAVC
jgi:hypothetical protein